MEKSEGLNASKREDEVVDLISNMPDSVLLLILSSLDSTEEAIRTSILSTQWSMSTVWRWIYMAVTRKVKQLDLRFCPKDSEETDHVEMPHCIVTCPSLEILRLSLCNRVLHLHNVTGFPVLRVLELSHLDLPEDEDLVKSFLESLSLLEDLTLLDCLLYQLDLLCISCPKLKTLSILNTDNKMEDGLSGCIKISCPKLVDMELRGLIANSFFFECLDSLNEAVIEPKLLGNMKSVFFPGISRVEHLLIDLCFFSQCISAAHDPGLPNLKTLVLTTTIDAFTMDELNQILSHYPKVESLNLITEKAFDRQEEWELHKGEATKIMTPDVKRVEFLEFKGEKPKLVSYWDDGYTVLEMVFSWGTKAKHFQYRLCKTMQEITLLEN